MSARKIKRDSFMSQFAMARREVQRLRKLYPHCFPKPKNGDAR